ncbi:MAG: hypothetical protein HZA01_04300 [Nitrospinae bacterium]|nr:hypothetical protein [Nitrospinota bacterium]
MDTKPSVLVLSTSQPTRIAIANALKEEGIEDIAQPKITKPEEILPALIDQCKKNFNPKNPSEKRELIILNCRKNAEYRRGLENLSKEIMKNRFNWNKEGINISLDDVSSFLDECLIVHFVVGADFVYQIEDNQKVRVSFGDINTDEFLSCANLFGELGISFSTYFEKNLEPTVGDLQQYNDAMKRGKEEVMRRMAAEKLSGDDISKVMRKKLEGCSMSAKVGRMKERLGKDVKTFFSDKEKRKDVAKKRVDIMESADTFKQYLALKDQALEFKEQKNYEEMEKTLAKAIELLEGTGDAGKRSLFDTYIELGKSQIQLKKFISSQRNAANAKRIRREAPSPMRLMGECQMGQATEALKKGNYEEATKFFDRANEYMAESQKLSAAAEKDEAVENDKEIALTISYFKEETQKIVELDQRAQESLKMNISYNLLCKTAADLKKTYKIVEEGEISPDISIKEINNKLHEANKLLKTPIDPSACNELFRKLLDANAERVLEQLLGLDGLLAKILENTSDTLRYERALVFLKTALNYETPQKEMLSHKFHEINLYIAADQLDQGVNMMKGFLRDPDNSDSLRHKEKALIHFQKAFNQHEEIVGDVAEMMARHMRTVQQEIGNSEAILLGDAALKIEFSDHERPMLEPIREVRKEIRAILDEAKKVALEASDLVLNKKLIEARTRYEQAVKVDEMAAFRAVSAQAKELKGNGEIRKAYDLYSWIARVDRNETDLQYINAAWCCLLLGDRDRAKKHIEAALLINKNVIDEAAEMDPEFKESGVMQIYREEWQEKIEEEKRAEARAAAARQTAKPASSPDSHNIVLVKKAAQALAARDFKGAFVILKKLQQHDPKAFDKLIARQPSVRTMPVYVFYLSKVAGTAAPLTTPTAAAPALTPASQAASKPSPREEFSFVMEANKLFIEGKKKDAVLKLIQALKKDRMILVKACGASEKFKQGMLMKFYYQNKVKLPQYLGFEPQP